MKYKYIPVISFFILVFGINLFFNLYLPDNFSKYKKYFLSLSGGDKYYANLSLWYYLAQNGNWSEAEMIESKLDLVDIETYKNTHHPQKIKEKLSQVESIKNKTTEDWMELFRISYSLGDLKKAKDALDQARQLDPVRDDISKLYFSLSSLDLDSSPSSVASF